METTISQKIRVPLGLGYSLIYLVASEPLIEFFILGIFIVKLGLALRIWAAGHIDKGRRLSINGPYYWSRNPLYLGSCLIGFGFTVISSQIWLIPIFCVLFFAVYIPVMRQEESELEMTFGMEYLSYCEQVPFFLPLSRCHSKPERKGSDRLSNFEWRRVISNREHRAIGGSVILTVLTILKIL